MVYFNYFWLRDNCPTAWDSSTQERTFDILEEPDDLHATSAWLNEHSLEVIWSDGYQSRYCLNWLSRWHKGDNHGDLAVRARKTWYGDHYPDMARFTYDDLMAKPASVADWAEAMLDEGVALIKGAQFRPRAKNPLRTVRHGAAILFWLHL